MERLHDHHLRLWGLPLLVLLTVTVQMPVFFPDRWDLWWQFCLIGIVLSSLSWEIARLILLMIREHWNGLENTRKRILSTLVSFAVLQAILHLTILGIVDHLGLMEGPVLTGKSFLINFSIGLFFVVVLGGYFEAGYFFRNYKQALTRTEQIKKERAQQRLSILKSRVNPHFLFNSLTTLSALIPEDRATAERFVDELSKVYRYLLRANWNALALLEEELAFLASYSFLLNVRYGGAFQVQVADLNGALNSEIPVLSLQSVVEHITRTQTISADKPLTLDIRSTADRLTVSCPNQPKIIFFNTWEDPKQQLNTEIPAEWPAGQPETTEGRLYFHFPLIANAR